MPYLMNRQAQNRCVCDHVYGGQYYQVQANVNTSRLDRWIPIRFDRDALEYVDCGSRYAIADNEDPDTPEDVSKAATRKQSTI